MFGRTQLFRFLVAGGMNTALTYAAYLVLLLWMKPIFAFAIVYVLGVLFSYAINARWVFGGQWTLRGLASFPVVHVVQALVVFGLFDLLTRQLQIPATYAPLLVIAITIPLTFLLARRVVIKTSRSSGDTNGTAR